MVKLTKYNKKYKHIKLIFLWVCDYLKLKHNINVSIKLHKNDLHGEYLWLSKNENYNFVVGPCHYITINRKIINNGKLITQTIIHELYHCFQKENNIKSNETTANKFETPTMRKMMKEFKKVIDYAK